MSKQIKWFAIYRILQYTGFSAAMLLSWDDVCISVILKLRLYILRSTLDVHIHMLFIKLQFIKLIIQGNEQDKY